MKHSRASLSSNLVLRMILHSNPEEFSLSADEECRGFALMRVFGFSCLLLALLFCISSNGVTTQPKGKGSNLHSQTKTTKKRRRPTYVKLYFRHDGKIVKDHTTNNPAKDK